MRNSQALPASLRLILYALLSAVLIFLLVGVIHLFAGWRTIQQYGNGLIWAGGIGAILLLVGAGWRNGRREEQASLSGVMREHEVYFLLNRENDGRARFMLSGLVAMIIIFVIGLILVNI
jgi:hypothetical protein